MSNENTPKLSSDLKEKLIKILFDNRMGGMFGDGLERDYIMDGVRIVGLNEMSDEELVEEYETYYDEDDELLVKCKIDLEIEKKLSE